MTQAILDRSRVMAGVGQGVPTAVPQHMGMNSRQAGALADALDLSAYRIGRERAAAFSHIPRDFRQSDMTPSRGVFQKKAEQPRVYPASLAIAEWEHRPTAGPVIDPRPSRQRVAMIRHHLVSELWQAGRLLKQQFLR